MNINSSASQSEEGQEQERHSEEEIQAYYEAFGIDYPGTDEPGDKDEDLDEDPDIDSGDEDPAIDPAKPADIKGLQVKYNGQETLVPDEEVRGYVEKGMNYDKIKGRNQQYESALDRLAQQQGYKDHAELLDNLDQIEQAAVQKRKDDFDGLQQNLRDEAVNAGIDPGVLDQYLKQHPLLQQAQELIQQSEQAQTQRSQQTEQQQQVEAWESFFRKYPDLANEVSEDGTSAPWLTQDMQSRIQRGYDPIDAYELVHRDKLSAQTRKQAEQSFIKNQRLNKRSQVETNPPGSLDPQAPQELRAAFAAFGLDPAGAEKYAKNFEK
ncbi:hypothetical protein ASD24_26725 [Paenibacillus sp. Root52]|uniref:hypothetical protein n=1 Tax=Paenibacillus sp. Root52 TaxID=1736552 RepID=UPI0006F64E84|nr:hypothetical protein [Paenibacillus sp. Root52]KQY87073.1 hypothetical protein ASD24_26725 [Paenibacillus sp. Root52]